MNKTKSIQLPILIVLLAVNAGLPLQANDSLPQRIIGGLLKTPAPIQIGCAVAAGATAYGSLQRFATKHLIGPKVVWGSCEFYESAGIVI